MIRSCTKCRVEYIDHRYIGQYRCYLCLLGPFLFPFFGMYVCVMTTFVVLTFGCFFFLCCGARKEANDPFVKNRESGKSKISFHPGLAARTVLSIIFFPFIYFFDALGAQCCCGLSGTSDESSAAHQTFNQSPTGRRSDRKRHHPRSKNEELGVSSTKDEADDDEEEED